MAAKRTTLPTDEPQGEVEQPAPVIAPPAKPAAKKQLTLFEMACAAIAAHRQNDSYAKSDTPDWVQYRNGIGRFVASANKQRVRDLSTGNLITDDAGARNKADAALEAYKNFTAADAMDAKQIANIFFVVTKDGEKFRYDVNTGKLI